MFKEGCTYKHDSCLDMTIYVASVDEDPELVCVFYMSGRHLLWPESEWIRIPKDNWGFWKQVEGKWTTTKS